MTQARRARRLDLQLLRRLGPELHVLDRRHAQLDRPVLRDAELQRAEPPDAGGNQSREWYRPNPTPPNIMWGPRANVNMQQSALLISMNNVAKNHGDVPRELLPQEQAHHRARPDQGALRLRDSGGAAASGRSRRADEPDPPRRRRGPHRERRVHRRHRRRRRRATTSSAWISRTARSSETLLGVQFYPPDNPRPLRRHRLGDSAGEQRQGDGGGRQGDPAAADDAGERRLQDRRHHLRHRAAC